MKKIFFMLFAAISTITVLAQSEGTRMLRIWQNDSVIWEVEAAKVDSLNFYIIPPNSINGHEYVDLGLPSGTLWATCNVGATNPEDYGDYFAWGETQPKSDYSWETYKYGIIHKYSSSYSVKEITKYTKDDNKNVLDSEDDAVITHWGNNWRMPTESEMEELYTNCSWEWTDNYNNTGVKGRIGRSKTDATKYIFLPAAGSYKDTVLNDVGIRGEYWSSSLEDNKFYGAYYGFNSTSRFWNYNLLRSTGRTIRPIYPGINKFTVTVGVDTTMGKVMGIGEYFIGETVTLIAIAKDGYTFTQWNDGNTDNPRTFTLTTNTTMVAIFTKEVDPSTYEYVDLGLPSGTLWATCNVGADNPEEYGGLFAWGEVTTKRDANGNYINYNWHTYKHGDGGNHNLTKYSISRSFGVADGKTILEAEDDAAVMHWGGDWRMPTQEEQYELKNSCTWTWTTINGVNGYEVQGTNGKSIFLPAAGYAANSTLVGEGRCCVYWSSSLQTTTELYAYRISLFQDSQDIPSNYQFNRCYGFSVRPVCSGTPLVTPPTPEIFTVTVNTDITMGSVVGAGEYEKGTEVTLTAYPEDGYQFVEWSDGNTENPRTILVTEDIYLFAMFEVETEPFTPEYVDLGLTSGTLWATCNVGATKPEESGNHFAWGDTQVRWGVWTFADYKFTASNEAGEDDLTKYTEEDGLATLESVDDVASVMWGNDWRMPTITELQELLEECTWTWTNLNGTDGYNVFGPNGNYIFLPAAGYSSVTSAPGKDDGSYWSSSLLTEGNHRHAHYMYFNSTGQSYYTNFRHNGRSVRPVYSPITE